MNGGNFVQSVLLYRSPELKFHSPLGSVVLQDSDGVTIKHQDQKELGDKWAYFSLQFHITAHH